MHSLYHLLNKGSWRALSFIFAMLATWLFFFNIGQFATALRHVSAYWVILILWSTVVVWIHGIGFDMRSTVGKIVFCPLFAYIIISIALISHFVF